MLSFCSTSYVFLAVLWGLQRGTASCDICQSHRAHATRGSSGTSGPSPLEFFFHKKSDYNGWMVSVQGHPKVVKDILASCSINSLSVEALLWFIKVQNNLASRFQLCGLEMNLDFLLRYNFRIGNKQWKLVVLSPRNILYGCDLW